LNSCYVEVTLDSYNLFIYLFIKRINIVCFAGSQLTSMKETQYLQFADQQEETVANINLFSLMGQGHVKVRLMSSF